MFWGQHWPGNSKSTVGAQLKFQRWTNNSISTVETLVLDNVGPMSARKQWPVATTPSITKPWPNDCLLLGCIHVPYRWNPSLNSNYFFCLSSSMNLYEVNLVRLLCLLIYSRSIIFRSYGYLLIGNNQWRNLIGRFRKTWGDFVQSLKPLNPMQFQINMPMTAVSSTNDFKYLIGHATNGH